MVEITINGEVFNPKNFNCNPRMVKTGDETMTLDGVNHVEARKLKRFISSVFVDLSRSEMARLLQAVFTNSTQITVTYPDPLSNTIQTRLFILQNDPSIPVKIWKNHLQYYEGTAIELLEKGAE